MARLPHYTVFVLDRLGRKPYLGLLGGGWESPGVPRLSLTLNDTAPELVTWNGDESQLEVELSVDVVLELFAQLTMFLAEFEELRRRNNWLAGTEEVVGVSAEPRLGPVPNKDRIRLRLLREPPALMINVGPDTIEVRASESVAQKILAALKHAVAGARADHALKSLEEIP